MRPFFSPGRMPRSLVALSSVIIALAAPRPSVAQVQIGASGGWNVPQENAGNTLNGGWMGQASVWFTAPDRSLGARVQGALTRWTYTHGLPGRFDPINMVNYNARHATADAIWTFR